MFGRKARRIRELEQALGQLEATHQRQTAMVRDMRGKAARQKQSLREQTKALARDRRMSRDAADLARLALAGLTVNYHPASIHDGNHPRGECEACDAYRALEAFSTKPWHAVIRRRQLTSR